MSFMFLVVVWSLTFLTAVESCQDIEQVNCNDSILTISSLYDREFAANSTVCVNLQPNSTETLGYTDTALNFSVVVRGNSSNSVTCEENPTNTDVDDLSSYTHFPLRFHNASFVIITGVHFNGCKRPLQFQWVQSIVISSSNFT